MFVLSAALAESPEGVLTADATSFARRLTKAKSPVFARILFFIGCFVIFIDTRKLAQEAQLDIEPARTEYNQSTQYTLLLALQQLLLCGRNCC